MELNLQNEIKKILGFFDEEFRQEKIATKDPLVILSTIVRKFII